MRIHLLIAVMLISLPAGASTGKRIFRHASCGIEFKFPKAWMVRAGEQVHGTRAEPCSFYVSPKNLKSLIQRYDMDLFTISVRVRNIGFSAGVEESGFVHESDGWKVLGRHGMTSPAEMLTNHGWKGLRGTSEAGCYYEDGGGYAGLCPVPAAFIGTENVSAELFGATEAEEVFGELLANFRFIGVQE